MDQVLSGLTQVRVQVLAENAVRLTHAPLDATEFPPDRPWLADVLLPQPAVPVEQCQLVVDLVEGRARVRTRAGQTVLAEARPPQLQARRRQRSVEVDIPAVEIRADFSRLQNMVRLTLGLEPGEGFYGWGEWFNAFRREHGKIKLKIRDAIAMLQHRETYAGIPLFISSRGYAFWLLNSHESEWKLAPEHKVLEISAAGPGADYVVIYGPAYRDLIKTYTQLTGRPPLIPRWAFGLMVTGYPQEHQTVVLERAREHRRRQIPLDAVILDYHWEERYHNFQWRKTVVPDPDQLIAELKAQGTRLGLIFTPFVNRRNRPGQRAFLNALAGNVPRGLEKDDERDEAGYAEAVMQGYLAHPNARWWLGAGGMIDFSNPAAAAWWNARLKPLYAQGVAFFKNDDGEYLPRTGRSALGLNGREYHNLYGFYYNRAIYAGMAALDQRRPFIYARSSWAGCQRFPALFLGDQKPTFAHMRSALRAGLNMSLLGFAYWTADVFGLDGKTTQETHMRYAQWALLVPVARYFWRPPEVDATRLPWSHSPQAEANFRVYAELRYRLLPYYTALGWEAYRTGLPLVRPLMLEFQNDARLADVSDQFLLGDRLLLAPVLQPEADRRLIVLPRGVWHDFWSTRTYVGGGEMEYAAPLTRLPLLVRGGTILPMGPALPHIPADHRFDPLELHVWPPYPARGVFYDDDGCTRAYQQGAFSVTQFTAEAEGQAVVVRLAAAEGSFPEQVTKRRVTVVLHRATRPQQVRVQRAPCETWKYDADRQCVLVELTASPQQLTEVALEF